MIKNGRELFVRVVFNLYLCTHGTILVSYSMCYDGLRAQMVD